MSRPRRPLIGGIDVRVTLSETTVFKSNFPQVIFVVFYEDSEFFRVPNVLETLSLVPISGLYIINTVSIIFISVRITG